MIIDKNIDTENSLILIRAITINKEPIPNPNI